LLIKDTFLFGLRYSFFSFLSRLFFNRISLKYLLAKEYRKDILKKHTNILSFKINKKDLVSVVIPVNNALSKGKLGDVIDSLLSQSWKNIEIIAVDSGSTDDTVKFLKKRGVKVIEIKPSLFTHAYSRNTGASIAKGKFILFTVDDAVFFDSDWILKSISYLEYFKADAISTNQLLSNTFDNYSYTLNKWHNNSQSKGCSIIRLTYIPVIIRGFIKHFMRFIRMESIYPYVAIDDTNHLIRKKIFDQFLYTSPTVEDINIALRMVMSGRKVIFTNLFSIQHNHLYSRDIKSYTNYLTRINIDLNEMKNNPTFNVTGLKKNNHLPISYLLLLKDFLTFLKSSERSSIISISFLFYKENWYQNKLKNAYQNKLFLSCKGDKSHYEILNLIKLFKLDHSLPSNIKITPFCLKYFYSICHRAELSFQYFSVQSLQDIERLLIYLTVNDINEFICRGGIELKDIKFSDWK
jgi:glycosyltransferase involved in cell wall biosynthesis